MPVVCDSLVVAPSTSASPIVRSKSPKKSGTGKKSYLPPGVYLKAGPASQAIEALASTSDDDGSQSSEKSSNNSDRSFRTRAKGLDVRRFSPRNPRSLPKPVIPSRPFTRGQQRNSITSLTASSIKPKLPSPAKEVSSINGTSIDRTLDGSNLDRKKQPSIVGEDIKEATASEVEVIASPSTSQYLHISRMKRKLAHAASLLRTSSAQPEDGNLPIKPAFSDEDHQNGGKLTKTKDDSNEVSWLQANASAKSLVSSNRKSSRAKAFQNGVDNSDGPSTSQISKRTTSIKMGMKKRNVSKKGRLKTNVVPTQGRPRKRHPIPLESQVVDGAHTNTQQIEADGVTISTKPAANKKRRQRWDAPDALNSFSNGATTSEEANQHPDGISEPTNISSIKTELVDCGPVAPPSTTETGPRRLRNSTPRNASECGSVRSRNGLVNGTRSQSTSRINAVHKMEVLEIVAPAFSANPSPAENPIQARTVSRRKTDIHVIVSTGRAPQLRKDQSELADFKSGPVAPSIAISQQEDLTESRSAPEAESLFPLKFSSGQDGPSTSRTRSSSSKFELIWQSKKKRTTHLLSLSPELLLSPTESSLTNEQTSQSIKGRKRRQPRERFSPDTFTSRKNKLIRSPVFSRGIKRGRPGRGAHDNAALLLNGVFDTLVSDVSLPSQSIMSTNLVNGKKKKMMKKKRKAKRLLPRVELQRRRRQMGPSEPPAEDSSPVQEVSADAKNRLCTLQTKKKRTKLTGDKIRRRRNHVSLDEGNDVLVGQIAEAAHLNPPATSINAHNDVNMTSSASLQAALFSPEPSIVSVDDSSIGPKPIKKTRTVSIPFNSTKPDLVGRFHSQHPLIPAKSRRSMTVDTTLTDLSSAIPTDLPEKNLLTILTSSSLLATQSNVVHARWKYITDAKLLLRRNLTYNVSARRFKPPPSFASRTVATKKRNLECFVQQLWHCLDGGKDTKAKSSYLHPVELEVTTFTLLKPGIESPNASNPQSAGPVKREIDVQLTVLKKNPKETLVKDLLPPILTHAVKLKGMTAGGKVVNFGQKNKVRLEYWNMNDFLVVNMDSPNAKQLGKVVAFNIGDIKDGLALEVAGHFSLRVLIRKAAPVGPAKVDYKFVIIYATGQHYQVRDMVYLRHHLKGHSCLLCGMRCDSLCTLLRHIEGLHPSMGYEYDEDTKRLYIWFAPEHDFVRAPVPGLVDHWGVLHFHSREDGTARLMYPDATSGVRYGDGRPVFQWASPKFKPNQLPDTLPKFDINHVLKVYGVAVNPVRHYLHTNPVQTIRPDYDSLRDYDSDEDTSWQDQYEQEKIHDFIDCNPQEKQFMCLWNTFTRRIGPIFSVLMKEVLCRFVVQYAMEIEMAEAYPALCAQLSIFRRDGIITPAESLEVVTRYRNTLLCQSQSALAAGQHQKSRKSDVMATNGLVSNGLATNVFNEVSSP